MDAATNEEIAKRAFQVFLGSFFYIFLVAKLIGGENKERWFKRRGNYTFFVQSHQNPNGGGAADPLKAQGSKPCSQ